MLNINEITRLYLGIQGENEARSIVIDVSPWMVDFPSGSVTIWHQRNGDQAPTATGAVHDSEAATVTWTPTDTDTYVSGEGLAEIRLYENGKIKKSRAVVTGVSPSVTGAGTPLGSDWQSYINAVDGLRAAAVLAKEAAVAAKEAAEEAASVAEDAELNPPYIDQTTGNWFVYDVETEAYVNSGVHAQGPKGDPGQATNVYATTVPMSPDDDTKIATALAGKAASTHTHDDRYYTKAQIDLQGTRIALVESGDTATQNIPAGSYLIWKGDFYRTKSAIASGNAISLSVLDEVSGGTANVLRALIDANTAEIAKAIKTLNGVGPDADGNYALEEVHFARQIVTDEEQKSSGEFLIRTTGGDASLSDGPAKLVSVMGRRTHTGYVAEELTMTVTNAERPEEQSGITATLDRDTFVAYVENSGTISISYDGSDWKVSGNTVTLSNYGITVSGTPISGDSISIVYVKENRGTITVATPESMISTGWNLYDNTAGYAKVIKYSDSYGFMIGGTYTSLAYALTSGGAGTPIVPEADGSFTIPGDGYLQVTGGSTDTWIIMTWSDWGAGYEGEFADYEESEIDLTDVVPAVFPNGMMQVGSVADELDISMGKAISRIERLAYNSTNLAAAIASGRAWEADTSYIYLVRATPVEYTTVEISDVDTPISVLISGDYTACDHGMEIITGSTVPVFIRTLYGNNLVDKLRTDVLTISSQELTNAQKKQARGNINAAAGITVDCGTISSLPATVNDARITDKMKVAGWNIGTEANVTLPLTVTTSNGSLTIAGTISASTTLTIDLIEYY